MGVDYSAALVVGVPKDDVYYLRDDDGYWDEEGVLEFVPCYYDADEGIVGIVIDSAGQYSYRKIEGALDDQIEAAKQRFKEITGLDGFLYISCWGY